MAGIDGYFSYDHPQSRGGLLDGVERLGRFDDDHPVWHRCRLHLLPVTLHARRQAADVDRLSNGRLILGLGIGDNVPDFRRMGLEFPPAGTSAAGDGGDDHDRARSLERRTLRARG